jgi:hypothetical protein
MTMAVCDRNYVLSQIVQNGPQQPLLLVCVRHFVLSDFQNKSPSFTEFPFVLSPKFKICCSQKIKYYLFKIFILPPLALCCPRAAPSFTLTLATPLPVLHSLLSWLRKERIELSPFAVLFLCRPIESSVRSLELCVTLI